jgi:hypothetical protein
MIRRTIFFRPPRPEGAIFSASTLKPTKNQPETPAFAAFFIFSEHLHQDKGDYGKEDKSRGQAYGGDELKITCSAVVHKNDLLYGKDFKRSALLWRHYLLRKVKGRLKEVKKTRRWRFSWGWQA